MSASVNLINEKYFKMVNPGVIGNSSDWHCNCDICGDSARNKNKKRLHLYTKSSFSGDVVHCWNCGYSSSAYNYFKDIHPEIFSRYKNEISNDIIKSLRKKDESLEDLIDDFDISPEKIKEENTISEEFYYSLTKSPGDNIRRYLEKRYLEEDISRLNIREGKSGFTAFGKTIDVKNSLIVPFYTKKNNIFGVQARNIEDKIFFTLIAKEFSGNKVWNLNNINPKKPVFAFESIFDAVSSGLDNIVALLGIDNNKTLSDLDIVFCLDNQFIDKTSMSVCKKLAKQGESLFIWDKNLPYKDFNEMLVSNKGDRTQIKDMILSNIHTGLDAYVRL